MGPPSRRPGDGAAPSPFAGVTALRVVPTIETARLRLRTFEPRDLDAQAAAMSDPEVVRHLGGRPFSREETWRKILASPGLWAMLGYGYWVAERIEEILRQELGA